MPPRLSALDASFLYLEQPTTPMHVGGVLIFQRPRAGFAHDRLVELIEQRIALVPRYRQKVRHVPGNLARPVWVDDPEFDIAYHVRRSALPRPGTDAQLAELVARLMSRPLDHTRPLWEMYLVEGLERERTAVLTKTHQAMVDGVSAIDIGQVILDVSAEPRTAVERLWMPRPEPTAAQLVLGAVAEAVARPGQLVDTARVAAGDAMATVGKVVELFSAAWTASRRAPDSPLNAAVSASRRFAMARTRLECYRRVRAAHGCERLYPPVAAIANRWAQRLGERRFPGTLDGLLAECADAGQCRPTPLMLRYGPGGYNCLHQDVYGELTFPLQLAIMLSRPDEDFTGGENVFVEQRPRRQSRPMVARPGLGQAVIFVVRHRPRLGVRGYHRVQLRHGVSAVHSGDRNVLGVIFHNAT